MNDTLTPAATPATPADDRTETTPTGGGGPGPGRVVALLVAALSLSVVVSMIVTAERTAPNPRDPAAIEQPDAPAPAVPQNDAPAVAGRTIDVTMTEFAFDPQQLELPAGTYTFAVTNDGAVPHEWMLSASGSHADHFAMTDRLGAGQTQEVEVTLEPGTYEYACHIAGHYEAGMTGTITVTG